MAALRRRFWSDEKPLRLTFLEGKEPAVLSGLEREALDKFLKTPGWLEGEYDGEPL